MKGLTDKQEGFAVAVALNGRNQSDAYRENYKTEGWTNQAIAEAASRVANDSKVAARIMELQKTKRDTANEAINFNVKKLLEAYFAIAFVDPNELISVRTGACRHCWGVNFGYQWKELEFQQHLDAWTRTETKRLASGKGEAEPCPDPAGGFGYRFTADPNPECPSCEGEGVDRIVPKDTTKLSAGARLLYRGAQQTKDGIKILFADQDKALDQLGRMLGAFDDKLALNLGGAVKSLHLTTSDPVEAARMYQAMVSGG